VKISRVLMDWGNLKNEYVGKQSKIVVRTEAGCCRKRENTNGEE
jgi:hypothetical protein